MPCSLSAYRQYIPVSLRDDADSLAATLTGVVAMFASDGTDVVLLICPTIQLTEDRMSHRPDCLAEALITLLRHGLKSTLLGLFVCRTLHRVSLTMSTTLVIAFLAANRAKMEAECQTAPSIAFEQLKLQAKDLIAGLDHIIETIPDVAINKLADHEDALRPLESAFDRLCDLDPMKSDPQRDIFWDGMQTEQGSIALYNARMMVETSLNDLPANVGQLPVLMLFTACCGVQLHWMQSRNIRCGPHYRWVKENIDTGLEELEDYHRQKLAKLKTAESEMRRLAVGLASLYLGKIDALSLQEDYIDWQEERNVEAFQRQHELRLKSIRERYVEAHKNIDEEESSGSGTEDDSTNRGDDRDSG